MRTRAVIISLGLLVALSSTACGSDGNITKVSGSGSSSGAGGSGSTNSGKVDTPFGDITIPDLGKLPGGTKMKKCTELGLMYASISLGAIGNDSSRAKASDAADKLAKDLPANLQSDIKVVRDAYAKFSDGISAVGKAMDTPEFKKANDEIGNYIKSACKDAVGG